MNLAEVISENKLIGEFKCDACQRIFYRKWVKAQRDWTRINDINYWTEGKKWNNYKIICRSCLNNWFEKSQQDFVNFVTEKKKKVFYNYRYSGVFAKGKEVYKD